MGLFSFFKKIKNPSVDSNYENKWQVIIENGTITSINYKGVSISIPIEKITKVIVETNDTGPWGTDVWWIISDGEVELTVPNGATGEQLMMETLQKMEGFDNEQFIKSMSSTDNAQFICFSKS